MELSIYKGFFAGKRITLMGLGLLGRGVGDAAFLAQLGATLVVTDRKPSTELGPSLKKLEQFTNIRYVLGEHRVEDFVDTDMVLKAAGVPLRDGYIAEARKASVPVYMSTALAAQFAVAAGVRVVGVTGTRGKSTVTHLIHHCLVAAGKRTHLGGNVRDVSTLALLPYLERGDVLVLELDSWQLQGFGDLNISPHVAVFTNLLLDHLNYYQNQETYFADKANIFTHQKADDTLIVSKQVLARVQKAHPPATPRVAAPMPKQWGLRLRGEHNVDNASLAAEALRALGLKEYEIEAGFKSFKGVQGRLELLGEKDGIAYYNDTNATTPEATVAALRSFAPGEVVLIAGGNDKNLPLEILVSEIKTRARAVVLLPGTGTERLKPLLQNYTEAKTMSEAVAIAKAQGGRVVLLSPGFTSFGLFKNEYDRNDQFVEAVGL